MTPDPQRIASRYLAAMLTMKKTVPTIPGALKEFRALGVDREEVGRVYQRRTTKEVFRMGRLMTVPVLGWFYRLPDGPEVGEGQKGPEWVEMSDAVDDLAVQVSHAR